MKSPLLGLLCCVAMPAAHAAQETFSITWVGIDKAGLTLFVGVDHAPTSSPCPLAEFKWSLSDTGVNQIVAVMLAAQAAGRSILMGVNTSTCVNSQPTADWARVNS
jgi:hypothetical protein